MTLLLWNDSIAWKCGWLWLSMAELSICWHPRTLASFTSHLSGEHSHRTFNNELKWVAEIKTKYFYLLFDYSFFGLFPSRNCRPQLNWIFPIQKKHKNALLGFILSLFQRISFYSLVPILYHGTGMVYLYSQYFPKFLVIVLHYDFGSLLHIFGTGHN